MVRSFKGNKYLSIPKYDFTVEPIDDIGTVNTSTETDEIRILEDVEVRGVKCFDSYKGCYTCKGKVTPTTEKIGKCNRCNSIQRKLQLNLNLVMILSLRSYHPSANH